MLDRISKRMSVAMKHLPVPKNVTIQKKNGANGPRCQGTIRAPLVMGPRDPIKACLIMVPLDGGLNDCL